MSTIERRLQDLLIREPNDWHFCYSIVLNDNLTLNLTSHVQAISVESNSMLFLPYSRIAIKEGIFDDINQNLLSFSGVFEHKGIEVHHQLVGKRIKIFLYFTKNKIIKLWLDYECTEFIRDELSFTINLTSITERFNQSLLNNFSLTCRTNFGDSKCKVDKALYSHRVVISEIINNDIVIQNASFENNYFLGGRAKFLSTGESYYIRANHNNIIELDIEKVAYIKKGEEVILTPSCDKTLITCCNKYNNAVNFRGEPFIPTVNYFQKDAI